MTALGTRCSRRGLPERGPAPIVVLMLLLLAAGRARAACAPAISAGDGVPVCTAAGDQREAAVCSDGYGGMLIAWEDHRGGAQGDIYAQHLTASRRVDESWPADGVPLCRAPGHQGRPRMVADGTGGALVVWEDSRSGGADLYVQRLTVGGHTAISWPEDGMALCDAPGSQSEASLVADGAGGAYAIWTDRRKPFDPDVYAQHVTGLGVRDPRWPALGLRVSLAPALQSAPALVLDGRGGALAAWQEEQQGGPGSDIVVQRITLDGWFDPDWPSIGVELCTAQGEQQFPCIVSDGAGGAFVAWHDHRGENYDIYVQRVLDIGIVAYDWPRDGVLVCGAPGGQFAPGIVSDGARGALVVWFDGRSGTDYDIYVQHVTDRGAIAEGWPFHGLCLCAAPGDQLYPGLAADGAGGAYVVWYDGRNGADLDVYATRVAGSGSVHSCWPRDGLALSTARGDQSHPVLARSGTDGTAVVWADARNAGGTDIYAELLRDGEAETSNWPPQGIALGTGPENQVLDAGDPRRDVAVPDGTGGMLVVWRDARSSALYLQRVDASGARTAGWPAGGLVMAPAGGERADVGLLADGSGGAWLVWSERRAAQGTGFDVLLQRATPQGGIAAGWPEGGKDVCAAPRNQLSARIVRDAAGGALVVWQDGRRGSDFDLYGLRLTSTGGVASGWPASGMSLCPLPGDQVQPACVSDNAGGMVLAWQDRRDGVRWAAYSLGIDADGRIQNGWPATGVLLSSSPGDQYSVSAVQDGSGGAIVLWSEARQGRKDLRLQRVSGAGVVPPSWPATGVPIYADVGGAGAQHASIAADGTGGAFVSWCDAREQRFRAYVQRIDAAGRTRPGWPANGVAAGGSSANQLYPALCSDRTGGALLAWVEFRPGADIFVQRLAPAGIPAAGWPAGGAAVCSAEGDQLAPVLVADAQGCAIVAWQDHRNGTDADVYARAVSPDRGIASGAAGMLVPRIRAAWPNPFRREARIAFDLSARSRVGVDIFDVKGRRVRALLGGWLDSGRHVVIWDGRTDAGAAAPAGVYCVRLRTAARTQAQKLVRGR